MDNSFVEPFYCMSKEKLNDGTVDCLSEADEEE